MLLAEFMNLREELGGATRTFDLRTGFAIDTDFAFFEATADGAQALPNEDWALDGLHQVAKAIVVADWLLSLFTSGFWRGTDRAISLV